MAENSTDSAADTIALAGNITIAWLQNPNVNPAAQDVTDFLTNMHATITGLGATPATEPESVTHEPAVSVRSSVKPDHIVSLIDGRKFKSLKRHLGLHGLTPDEYRARYGLKSDYPMVAETYAAERRAIAKRLGLGRKPAAEPSMVPAMVPDAIPEVPAKPKRVARKPKAEAVTSPVAEVEASVPAAKPRRMARKPKADVVPEAIAAPAPAPAKRGRAKKAPQEG